MEGGDRLAHLVAKIVWSIYVGIFTLIRSMSFKISFAISDLLCPCDISVSPTNKHMDDHLLFLFCLSYWYGEQQHRNMEHL